MDGSLALARSECPKLSTACGAQFLPEAARPFDQIHFTERQRHRSPRRSSLRSSSFPLTTNATAHFALRSGKIWRNAQQKHNCRKMEVLLETDRTWRKPVTRRRRRQLLSWRKESESSSHVCLKSFIQGLVFVRRRVNTPTSLYRHPYVRQQYHQLLITK